MSLARLAQAGLPLPGGFNITTDAYCHFIAVNGLQAKILTALQDVNTALPSTLEAANPNLSKACWTRDQHKTVRLLNTSDEYLN